MDSNLLYNIGDSPPPSQIERQIKGIHERLDSIEGAIERIGETLRSTTELPRYLPASKAAPELGYDGSAGYQRFLRWLNWNVAAYPDLYVQKGAGAIRVNMAVAQSIQKHEKSN